MRHGKIRSLRWGAIKMRGDWPVPIRLIALATLVNAALVVASFYPPAIVTEAGQHGFWPYALSHPMELSTALIAAFNGVLVFVTYRLVNSTDKLWETAIQESRRAHRAKLAMRRIHSPRFVHEEPMAVKLDLINHGVRDATIIASGSDLFVRPKDPHALRSFDANIKPVVPPVTIRPGDIMLTFQTIGAFPLSSQTIIEIMSGEVDAVLIANMQYSDEAGDQMASFFRIYDHKLGCFRRAESTEESQECEYTDQPEFRGAPELGGGSDIDCGPHQPS
jgi:hypothetical protein